MLASRCMCLTTVCSLAGLCSSACEASSQKRCEGIDTMNQHPFKPLLLGLLRQAQVSQNEFFQQLPPAELTAAGTPDHWAAKDHVAHMTFWRKRLIARIQAIVQHETIPMEGPGFEELNPVIF